MLQTGVEPILEVNRKKMKKQYRQGPEIAASEVSALEAAGAFTRVVTVAVVGHGAMIRKHCLGGAVAAQLNCTASSKCGSEGRVEPKVKANNNAVYEKLLTVAVTRGQVGTSVLLRCFHGTDVGARPRGMRRALRRETFPAPHRERWRHRCPSCNVILRGSG